MALAPTVRLAAAVPALLLAGCASFDRDPLAEWIDRNPPAWSTSDGGTPHSPDALPTTRPSDVDRDAVPAGATADDYVALALSRNPRLLAASYRIQRLEARVPQVTSLDDPMLTVTPIGEMAETAAGQVGTMTGLSQRFPLPQKLNARGDVARADVDVARAGLEQTRLQVVADTRQAYWGLYYAVRAIEQTRQSRELLDGLRQVTLAKLRAGTATQVDALRASTELGNLDNELLTLAQQRDTAAARLNSLIDRPVTAALPEPPPVEPAATDVRLDRLLAEAARGNPQIQQGFGRIRQGRSRLRLARLNYVPDLTVNLAYNVVDEDGLAVRADGKDQYWVGFGVNLPIWQGRLRAAEREAFAGIQENVADLTAAQDRLAFGVSEACAAVDTQRRLVALFRDTILPQARQTVDASAAGYQGGTVDFLAYVEAWRRLLEYRLMEQRAVSQLGRQLAELERLVGGPLDPSTESQP